MPTSIPFVSTQDLSNIHHKTSNHQTIIFPEYISSTYSIEMDGRKSSLGKSGRRRGSKKDIEKPECIFCMYDIGELSKESGVMEEILLYYTPFEKEAREIMSLVQIAQGFFELDRY